MIAWWNSLEVVDSLSFWARCSGAAMGVVILVLGNRLSVLQSEAKTAERRPRTISAEHRTDFESVLLPIRGQPIHLAWITTTAEASDFGQQVFDVLSTAGFDVGRSRIAGSGGNSPPGIKIEYPADNKRPIAEAIASAFRACGLPSVVESGQAFSKDRVTIIIGEKPIKQ